MMLSVAHRDNEDDWAIYELCFCLLDEMEDITFSCTMCIIIDALEDFTYAVHPDMFYYVREKVYIAEMRKIWICVLSWEYSVPLEINFGGTISSKLYRQAKAGFGSNIENAEFKCYYQ